MQVLPSQKRMRCISALLLQMPHSVHADQPSKGTVVKISELSKQHKIITIHTFLLYACFVDHQLIKGLDDYVRVCTMFLDQHLMLI